MRFKKYIKEGNLMDHIHPDWISKKILKVSDRKKINKDLQKLLAPTYFKKIPLNDMFKVLEKHGLVPIQEDNKYFDGFLIGGVKDTVMVNFNLGWKNELVDDKGIKKYMAVPNAFLTMSYHKMPSGKWEIIGYIS